MGSKNIRIQKIYIDYGLGFPVKLLNVPMMRMRGEWVPKINYNELTKKIIKDLAYKRGQLTGNEVKAIRLYNELTLGAFAKRFEVTHAAVIKWEKNKNQPTSMSWAIEKDIRLFTLSKFTKSAKELINLYFELENQFPAKGLETVLDVEKLAA